MLDITINLLNNALELDPDAINKLFSYHVECNEAIANHEAIQVRIRDKNLTDYTLGLLGLLNGIALNMGDVYNASRDTFTYDSILKHQNKNGLWIDGHNELPQYHAIIMRALVKLYNRYGNDNPKFKTELKKHIELGLPHIINRRVIRGSELEVLILAKDNFNSPKLRAAITRGANQVSDGSFSYYVNYYNKLGWWEKYVG